MSQFNQNLSKANFLSKNLFVTLYALIFEDTLNMVGLTDLYNNILKKPLPTKCGITCEAVDSAKAKLNRLLTESLSYFSYTLVIEGSAKVICNDIIMMIVDNDLLITPPGMKIKTLEVSPNFSALCLMGDEITTYEIPFARNVISATYLPGLTNNDNKISLTGCEPQWMEKRMREIYSYINSEHIYKKECLYSLYSLFILDLLNVESRRNKVSENNSHSIDLFLKFSRLLTENFLTEHEIAFYADKLAVTPIYLSRIVKRVSGQTVKNHIDRLLLMEATYLLISTDTPISIISTKLNFANPAGFTKFFVKHKGISPRDYRETNHIEITP